MLACVLVVLSAAPVTAAPLERPKSLSVESLRGHIRFLASDALEGRGPATPGDTLGQQYIAAQFETMGLQPGAPDGGWIQKVELVGVSGAPKTLQFAAGKQSLSLAFSDDFIAVSGHQRLESKLVNAQLVFVGYGIVAPEFGWNDFKDTDVKGKVVVVMNNDPEDDPTLFAGKARLWYGRWDYKYEQAAKLGAAGCIIIHTTPSAGYPWQVVQTSWSGQQFELPNTGAPTLEVKAWTTEAATRKLFALGGKELDALRAAAQKRDFKPVPLGITLSTAFTNTVVTTSSGNVLGLLPGSDPVLKNELVVYTAHHDHLGRKKGVKPGEDDIYNGAVDNASGVAAMLTAARALTSMATAPKRSILFASVAAEEQGLLGSAYLVEHSPVPLDKVAIDINIDGINIWGRTKDVSVIGLGKSTVDAYIVELARAQGRSVRADALSDRGFFYRSDQFNFAKRGVPSAYFSSGQEFIGRPDGWGKQQREKWEGTKYHQPSDQLDDSWDLSGAVEDVELYFRLGLAVANAPSMPTWTPGDEFEAARMKAVAK